MAEMVQQSGSSALIVLDEELLHSGMIGMRERVDRLFRAGCVSVVIDVTNVPRLSSTMLASLLWTHRACQRRGGSVTLRGASRGCRAMLARTGLQTLFTQPTAEEAR